MKKVQQFRRVRDIPFNRYYPVVWLASWYPSPTYPTNGDFIQRHAECVGVPLLVIHTVHAPYLTDQHVFLMRENGPVTEIIILFRQTKEGGSLWTRFLYHSRYMRLTRILLTHLISQQGKPKLFHVHVPMKMGLIAQWARQTWNIPFMISEQSSKYVGDGPDHFHRRPVRHQHAVARIFQDAVMATNVSATVGELLKKKFSLQNVKTIHNTVDLGLFFPGNINPSSICRFLHASTLTSQKNVEGLVSALEKVRTYRQDFQLTILGGTDDQVFSWQHQDWIRRISNVPHQEVADIMRDADALLMFSNHENFPCVIVEALCSGLAVITSDAGGSAEAITDSNGLVIPVGDEKALASAIGQFLDNRHLYHKNNISHEAARLYSYAAIGSSIREMYKNLGITELPL